MSDEVPPVNDQPIHVSPLSTELQPTDSQPVELPSVDLKPSPIRELGVQPIAELMEQYQLKAHDLVTASSEQLTHKMVARAVKGRRLTSNSKGIVQRAFNKATQGNFTFSQLFNY